MYFIRYVLITNYKSEINHHSEINSSDMLRGVHSENNLTYIN